MDNAEYQFNDILKNLEYTIFLSKLAQFSIIQALTKTTVIVMMSPSISA
jgi:hypothetical protein